MRMKDQVAIVTGAASGIGKEIASAFAREGAKVGIADLNLEGAKAAVAEIEKEGGSAMAVAMDVTDENAADAGTDAVVAAYGGLDVLVSNAGIQHIDAVVDLSLADWRKILAVHLDGAFLTTRAALRHMYKAAQGGIILYMSSVHGKTASGLKAPYVTAKHGLLGLCRTVAKEGAERGIRTNVICPGFVRTPLVEKQFSQLAGELGISEEEVVRDVMLKETIDGEFTTMADVAEIAVFLASFPSTALTGQSILASHGWHME
jgi:3-hydroxybutyrate dehydrogenase